MSAVSPLAVPHEEVEKFLYTEARLLDKWLLDEWLTLFSKEANYLVPVAGASDDADPVKELFYINDDFFLLSERVHRISKETAHAEFPHSLCRRLVSNVLIISQAGSTLLVTSNFITFRTKMGKTDTFFGHHNYELTVTDEGLKIMRKMSFIDQQDLYEQAKVSIIL